MLQHIRKTFSLIHNNIGACHSVFGQLPGNLPKLGPGQSIFHLIWHGDPCCVCHIFIVKQRHRAFCSSHGIQLSIISSLDFNGLHKIIHIFFGEIRINGNYDSIHRIVGNIRPVHIQNIWQIVRSNRGINFILISVRICPHNGFPLYFNFPFVCFIKFPNLLNPPLLNGWLICRTPDSNNLCPVFVGIAFGFLSTSTSSQSRCRKG